jgi:glutamate synthase domain-containing protein 2
MLALWIIGGLLVTLALYDLTQRRHAILRNFPVIGHLRYLIEALGPELRQYIVADNDEERPFSRDQRRWVYASAKRQNNYFGFGTDNALDRAPGYLIIKQSAFPLEEPHKGEPGYDPTHPVPCAKVLGAWRGRRLAFRPASVVNLSAMSFGSLSHAAVEAINRGCRTAGCLHNTGEGGIAPHHDHGGDLIWQLGTGYYGARTASGHFDLETLVAQCTRFPVRAIEIKLSQGAKPGRGGVLPGAKVTPEIATIRGIPVGQDCISPAAHRSFSDVDGLIDFVESIADATGLPVGIKSAVGDLTFWETLAQRMSERGEGPDYIAIDGGEGGTGAAPLVFSDHVSLPFLQAFPRVYRSFVNANLHDQVVFIGAGRLGFPQSALTAMALGCDMIAVAREAMLAIGCIQAQKCQSGHCPTGVATHNRWLVHGLDPTSKADRLANYLIVLRKELMWLARACGVPHPALVTTDQLELLEDTFNGRTLRELVGYEPGWGLPSEGDQSTLAEAPVPKV